MLRRIGQFREARRQPSEADLTLARRLLPPALLPLFLAQHPRDAVHSAATARWLMARGQDDSDLLIAALLHDVGKGGQRRRDRTAHVLASSAGIESQLADPRSRFELRRALARSLDHSARSARLLAEAGGNARAVELVRLHHSAARGDGMLTALQEADAAN